MLLGANSAMAYVIDFDSLTTSGGCTFGACATDGAFKVDTFWFDAATPNWASLGGHFHTANIGVGGSLGEAQHWNGAQQLQGLVITRTDGQAFSLTSLDYRVSNSSFSVDGFSGSAVNILLAGDSFMPAGSLSSQFTGFNVGGVGASFSTLFPTGFGSVTKLFVSSSASAYFDNIVLDGATQVPEPGTLGLLGLGFAVLGWSARRRIGAR